MGYSDVTWWGVAWPVVLDLIRFSAQHTLSNFVRSKVTYKVKGQLRSPNLLIINFQLCITYPNNSLIGHVIKEI